MHKHLSVTALLSAASITIAQAQTPTSRAREQHQRARIRQGIASGELTQREAARLRSRKAGLTAERQAARTDGVVTAEERHDLRQTENRNSRAIYRQKHDAQAR